MATKFYIGNPAAAVGQVDRFTPANVEVGDVFTLTVTGQDGSTAAINFTATATTVANVTAGLTAAWNASTNPLVTPVTAADASTSLTLTADTAGVPFSVAATTTDGGGSNTQTLTRAAVTANVGPADAALAANYSDSAAPANSDTLVLDNRMQSALKWGLNQSGVTLTQLTHYAGAKQVGDTGGVTSAALPPVPYLRVSATTADINKPPTDGSNPSAAFVAVDTGTNATATNVWGSASAGLNGVDPVALKGTHASNVLRVYDGRVGVATLKPGDTASYPTVYLIGRNARLTLSGGVTSPTTLTQSGGTLVTRTGATTFNLDGGEATVEGAGTYTTINCNGALVYNGTGTVTTLNVEDGGDVDLTQAVGVARTITVINIYGKGKVKLDRNTTVTNGTNLYRGATSAQLVYPDNVNIPTAGAAA